MPDSITQNFSENGGKLPKITKQYNSIKTSQKMAGNGEICKGITQIKTEFVGFGGFILKYISATLRWIFSEIHQCHSLVDFF
jgi:uncharacterized membrane protein